MGGFDGNFVLYSLVAWVVVCSVVTCCGLVVGGGLAGVWVLHLGFDVVVLLTVLGFRGVGIIYVS